MHKRNFLRFVLTVFAAAITLSLYTQPSMIHLGLSSGLKKGKSAPVAATWTSENSSGTQNVVFGQKPELFSLQTERRVEILPVQVERKYQRLRLHPIMPCRVLQ